MLVHFKLNDPYGHLQLQPSEGQSPNPCKVMFHRHVWELWVSYSDAVAILLLSETMLHCHLPPAPEVCKCLFHVPGPGKQC